MIDILTFMAELTLIIVFLLASLGLTAWGIGHGVRIALDVRAALKAWRGK